jgi:uncharacterized protein YjbI with pentapeptide repeats
MGSRDPPGRASTAARAVPSLLMGAERGARVAPHRPRLPGDLAESGEVELVDDGEWQSQRLRGDSSNAVACDVEIGESVLDGVWLTGSRLDRLRLTDCILEGCDLSGAVLDAARLTRVELRECRLSGFVVSRADLRDVRFAGCRLDDASFRMATAERIVFDGCDLRGADLTEARFAMARFAHCDLTGAELSKADLRGARVQGSRLDDLKGARSLQGAVIDSSQIVAVSLGILRALDIRVDDEIDDDTEG